MLNISAFKVPVDDLMGKPPIHDKADDVLDILLQLLESSDPKLKQASVDPLASKDFSLQIGSKLKPLLPIIRKRKVSPKCRVRQLMFHDVFIKMFGEGFRASIEDAVEVSFDLACSSSGGPGARGIAGRARCVCVRHGGVLVIYSVSLFGKKLTAEKSCSNAGSRLDWTGVVLRDLRGPFWIHAEVIETTGNCKVKIRRDGEERKDI